jgi:hypothetical protein
LQALNQGVQPSTAAFDTVGLTIRKDFGIPVLQANQDLPVHLIGVKLAMRFTPQIAVGTHSAVLPADKRGRRYQRANRTAADHDQYENDAKRKNDEEPNEPHRLTNTPART